MFKTVTRQSVFKIPQTLTPAEIEKEKAMKKAKRFIRDRLRWF